MALKKFLQKFYKSIWSYVFVAVAVVLGWSLDVVLPVVCVLAVYCFISCIVCENLSAILFPVVCVPYMLRNELGSTNWIFYGCAIGVFFIGIAIFILNHSNRRTRKGRMFWFIVIADIAYLLGGIIANFSILNFAITFGISLIILFMYWMCINFVGDNKRALAKSFVFLAFVIIAEMAIAYLQIGDIAKAFSEKLVKIGTGEINTASIFLCLGLMSALYLGCRKRRDYLYGFLALFIYGGIVLTLSRAGLLAGTIVLCIGGIYFILKSGNKKVLLTICAALVAVGLALTAVFHEKIFSTLSWYLEKGFSGNGRDQLWPWCWEQFKKHPIFGVGFVTSENVLFDGFDKISEATTILYAHNTFLQMFVSTGIFGLLLTIPMYVQKYRLIFTKFSIYKFFCFLQILAIEITGMFDSSACTHIVMLVIIWMIIASCENEHRTDAEKFQHVFKKEESRLLYDLIKRVSEVTICIIALIVFSPIFIGLFICTACFVGVPIFFVQPRPGKGGKLFNLIKFRSMSNKKDENGNLLPDGQRITWFGKFLRKTSLDELPQIFNIIKGDMSLIGPRPRLVADMVFYGEEVKSLDIRPGLTGLSQVSGRNLNTWEQIFELDKKYVEELGFGMDFKIFFKTFGALVSKQGTSSDGEMPMDYRYADYLLRIGKITQKEYDEGQEKARKLIEEFKNKKKGKVKKNVQK